MNIRYYSNVIIYRIVEWCTPVNERHWAGRFWQADVLPSKATTLSPTVSFPYQTAIKRETERFPTTQTSTGQTPEAWSEFLSHCTFWRAPLFLNVVISVNISPAHHTQIWNPVTIVGLRLILLMLRTWVWKGVMELVQFAWPLVSGSVEYVWTRWECQS